jgi:transcriptional regulator with XRE-family HTH domain
VISLTAALGQAIKSRREALGMTDALLAQCSRVSMFTLGRIENGVCPEVTVNTLARIASQLRTPLSALLADAESRLHVGERNDGSAEHKRGRL